MNLVLTLFFKLCILNTSTDGRLAQLVRASGLHPECREFDPLTVHKKERKFLYSKKIQTSLDI